ncbi:MAG TPA: hypothetical protein VGP93_16710 [Polyangiaceae bacterium]|nr:hypothetical protein [Polyangiaceae bacterium]
MRMSQACGSPRAEPESDTTPTQAQYDDHGVDLTLVRYTLGLTPTERLKAVENYMNAIASVRRKAPGSMPDPDASGSDTK